MSVWDKMLKLWVPVVIWAGAIFYFSSIPNLSTGWGIYDLILRKGAHMTEYFILAALLGRAFRGSGVSIYPRCFWAAFLVAILYAFSDEYHQSFVVGRGSSGWDVCFDSLGACLGSYLYLKLKFR
ncbi:MAG: VanZ family protein [Elusimicrobia bacterium]|nr:VanZ family protein [Elusimicrobiota bacterium]